MQIDLFIKFMTQRKVILNSLFGKFLQIELEEIFKIQTVSLDFNFASKRINYHSQSNTEREI